MPSRETACRYLRQLAALVCVVPLLAYAAVQQFPDDPEDTRANLASYPAYFGAEKIAEYALIIGADPRKGATKS
jgi:4-hydroxybenzoate polyprenyltransferase